MRRFHWNISERQITAFVCSVFLFVLLSAEPALAGHRDPDHHGDPCVNGDYLWWPDQTQEYEVQASVPSQFVPRIADAVKEFNDLGTTLRWSKVSSGGRDIYFKPIDGPGGTVGTTWVRYECHSNYLTLADIQLDSQESWYTGTGNAADGIAGICGPICQIDAWSVLTHEFGHASGLGHYYVHDEEATCLDDSSQHSMCRFYYGGTERVRTLEFFDEQAINDNY